MPTTYAKRHTRLKTPPNFELTRRAILLNTEICRHPLIRQDQLRALFPSESRRQIDRTLSLLFHNGFIARPRQQQELHRQVPGSLPTYLTPDRRGTQLHTAFFADPVATPKYTQDNDLMTWGYMRHQHTTTTTLISYRAGAATVPGVVFHPEPELWQRYAPDSKINRPVFDIDNYPRLMAHDFIANPPELSAQHKTKTPLELSARYEWAVHIPGKSGLDTLSLPMRTHPDGYFAHQTTKTSFFFLESDEGTETILPGQSLRHSMHLFSETSLFAKYLVYIAAFRKRSHTKQFGIPTFKVITVTTTPRRVEQIIDKLAPLLTARPLGIHSDFLLFTDRDTLARHDNNPYHPEHHHKNLAGEAVWLTTL